MSQHGRVGLTRQRTASSKSRSPWCLEMSPYSVRPRVWLLSHGPMITVIIYSLFCHQFYRPIHFQGDLGQDKTGPNRMWQESERLRARPGSYVHSPSVGVAAVSDEFSRIPTGEACPSISGTQAVPVFQQQLACLALSSPLHSKHRSVCSTKLHLEGMVRSRKPRGDTGLSLAGYFCPSVYLARSSLFLLSFLFPTSLTVNNVFNDLYNHIPQLQSRSDSQLT